MSTAIYRDNEQFISEESQWLLRIAAIYLALPFLFFAFPWLNTGANIILLILIAYGIANCWTVGDNKTSPIRTVLPRIITKNRIVFLVFFIWCVLSVRTEPLPANTLHKINPSSILNELIFSPWPVHGINHLPRVDNFFFYLPAAAAGKVFGWTAAQLFLFLWTYFGLILVWSLFSLALRLDSLSPVRKFVASTAFVLAGGWDYFGGLLNLSAENPKFYSHLESWASLGEFSGHTTLLFRSPQDALAPWIVTSAALLLMERRLGQNMLLLLTAFSFLWSPLPSLGLLPFIFLLIWREITEGQWRFVSGANFFTAPAIILLGFLFYTSSGGNFSLKSQLAAPDFTRNILLLFLLESVAIALPFFSQYSKPKIYLNQIDLPPPISLSSIHRSLGWTAFIILVFLPFFSTVDGWDFTSHASIPALLILFSYWVRILRREFTNQYPQLAVSAVCLILGSGAALTEIYRTRSTATLSFPSVDKKGSLGTHQDNQPAQSQSGRPDAIFWRWIGPQSKFFSPLQ
jgi:hypothetical protein